MKQIKKLSIIAVVVILILSTAMLCACNADKDNSGTTPTPQTYTIQYTDDTGLHIITVDSGALYSMESIPQRNGYEFLGLYDAKVGGTQYVDENGNCLSAFKDNCNLVLYPQFKAKEYTLVLNYGEAAVTGMRQMTVSYGQTIAELPMNLQVENKTFAGWFTEQNKEGVQVADQYGVIPDKAKVTESIFDLSNQDGYIYLYAGFKGQEYLVTFYYGDDPTPEEMMIEYGTYITDVVTTKRVDGKAVISWSKSKGSNAQNDIFTGKVTGAMVLYAYEYAPVIDFDSNGGNAVTSLVRKAGAAIDLPVPKRKDYTFVGWYTTSGDKYSASSMPSESVSLIAHWNAIISFNTNGGTAVDAISEPTGASISLPTTEKDGYMFAGWYTELNQEYTSTSMPEYSIKLTARYYKTIKITKVIIDQSKAVGGNAHYDSENISWNPSMDKGHDILDLSEIYNAKVKTVKLTVHYKVKANYATSSAADYTYMNWYSEEIASEAYKVWAYSEKHINGNYLTREESTTIQLTTPILHICRYVKTDDDNLLWNFEFYWTDFWVEIEYPDTSRLY